MKYKVGDIVKLRDDLELGVYYRGCFYGDYMEEELKGKPIEIKMVDKVGDYLI